MNMFKKNGGFTLVELIVVIAILAILAGVAVPAYSGYISRAEATADISSLEAIQTAAIAAGSLNAITGDVAITTDENGVVTKVTVGTTDVYNTDAEAEQTKVMADFEELVDEVPTLSLAENKGATITEGEDGWTATATEGEGEGA